MFGNPLGLLSLLAIPAIVAIHYLQQKSIRLPISTMFLLERTQREANSGRRFERLIPSVPLWMQVLAVLLLAWLLSEPRFKKENSVQRVAIVIDASASMTVFKKETVAALKKIVPKLRGSASAMELTLLPSTPGADRLYTGTSVDELLAAIDSFRPDSGLLDPSYSLRLARSIVSKNGIVIFLTDTPAEALPYDSQIISVGRPVGNVGFTGISFAENEGTLTWQAIIRNYSEEPVKRSWSLKTKTSSTEAREFEIGAKSFVSIQAAFPEGAEDVRIALSPDDFTLDDTMPMIAPRPKVLELHTATSTACRELTDKLLRSLAATLPSNDAASCDLAITSYDPLDSSLPESNAILFVEDPSSLGKYLKGGILAEAHPLMDGINWQSLLVRETLQLPRQPSDRVLLWQEKRPLIFLRENGDKRILCFNFDLRLSNTSQQPAFIVLLHRFAEMIRSEKIAYQALNLETNQPIRIATAIGLTIEAAAIDASGKSIATPPYDCAPSLPGFLTVSQGETLLLQAAIHFADTREADLSACAPTKTEPFTNIATLELHTTPDPFARIWVLVLLATLMVAWHFTAPKERAGEVKA